MKFDVVFERAYQHSRQSVWEALTDASALGQWLMETDFVPEAGRAFQMRCENPDGQVDHYLCKVIVIEPYTRMVWSWQRKSRPRESEMLVEFELADIAEGTRLTIRHSGDLDRAAIEAFKGGWPHKLDMLGQRLGR